MENNKYIKILLENVVFLILLQTIGFLLIDFRVFKILLFVILIILISYRNSTYIGSIKIEKAKRYFLFILSISILFEISKIISFFVGILPRYADIPILIGFGISFIVITSYFLLLLLTNELLIKKLRQQT